MCVCVARHFVSSKSMPSVGRPWQSARCVAEVSSPAARLAYTAAMCTTDFGQTFCPSGVLVCKTHHELLAAAAALSDVGLAAALTGALFARPALKKELMSLWLVESRLAAQLLVDPETP